MPLIINVLLFLLLCSNIAQAQHSASHLHGTKGLNHCYSMRAYGGLLKGKYHPHHQHRAFARHELKDPSGGHYSPVSYNRKAAVSHTESNVKTSEKEILEEHHLANLDPIILPPINFHYNQDELAVANMESFMQAVEYAKSGYMVLIEGHTDDRGAEDYNMNLSMKRVNRIKELMIQMGVDENMISAIGFGESQPIVPNDTEENRLKNRRIEFKAFKI